VKKREKKRNKELGIKKELFIILLIFLSISLFFLIEPKYTGLVIFQPAAHNWTFDSNLINMTNGKVSLMANTTIDTWNTYNETGFDITGAFYNPSDKTTLRFKANISSESSRLYDLSVDYQTISCEESWSCEGWSVCSQENKTRARSCSDDNLCGTSQNKPLELENCFPDYYDIENDSLISIEAGKETTTKEKIENLEQIKTIEEKEEVSIPTGKVTQGFDDKKSNSSLFVGIGLLMVIAIVFILDPFSNLKK
jgi:hypothetical protein